MRLAIESLNKRLVLDVLDSLFSRRGCAASEKYRLPNYIEHNTHIAAGREGLFALIRAASPSFRYESQRILADQEYVMIHGHFSNTGRARDWIAVDVVRIEEGLLKER